MSGFERIIEVDERPSEQQISVRRLQMMFAICVAFAFAGQGSTARINKTERKKKVGKK